MAPSRSASESSVATMASTWAAKARPVRPKPSGPSHPSTGTSRRNDRGPITQRAASPVIAPTPSTWARRAQPVSSSLRHGWFRHAVHANVSDRTRSGNSTAMIWLIAPPIDAPTTWASATPRSSSTATASVAMRSSVYGSVGLSLRPAPRLSRAMTRYRHEKTRRCRSQPCLSMPRPWIISTGGPESRPVTS